MSNKINDSNDNRIPNFYPHFVKENAAVTIAVMGYRFKDNTIAIKLIAY